MVSQARIELATPGPPDRCATAAPLAENWSGQQGSNLRPPDPKSGALPLRYARLTRIAFGRIVCLAEGQRHQHGDPQCGDKTSSSIHTTQSQHGLLA